MPPGRNKKKRAGHVNDTARKAESKTLGFRVIAEHGTIVPSATVAAVGGQSPRKAVLPKQEPKRWPQKGFQELVGEFSGLHPLTMCTRPPVTRRWPLTHDPHIKQNLITKPTTYRRTAGPPSVPLFENMVAPRRHTIALPLPCRTQLSTKRTGSSYQRLCASVVPMYNYVFRTKHPCR